MKGFTRQIHGNWYAAFDYAGVSDTRSLRTREIARLDFPTDGGRAPLAWEGLFASLGQGLLPGAEHALSEVEALVPPPR